MRNVYRTNHPVVLSRYAEIEHPTQLSMLETTVVSAPILWRGRSIGVYGFAFYIVSFCGSRILWRRQQFRLHFSGRIEAID